MLRRLLLRFGYVPQEETRGPVEKAEYNALTGKSARDESIDQETGLLISRIGRDADVARWAMEHSSYVSGMINIACSGLVMVDWKVQQKNLLTLETTLAPKHVLTDVVRYGAVRDTFTTVIKDLLMWYMLTNNGYLAVVPTTGTTLEDRSSLYVKSLNPMWLWMILDKEQGVETYVYAPYQSVSNTQDLNLKADDVMVLRPDQVIHLRGPNPAGLVGGLSQIESIRSDYDTHKLAKRSERNRVSMATKVQGVLTNEKITDPVAIAEMNSDIRRQLSKESYSGILLLGADQKYEPVPASQSDGLIKQVTQEAESSLSRWLRVPPHFFNSTKDQLPPEIERQLWTYLVQPFCKELAESMTKMLGHLKVTPSRNNSKNTVVEVVPSYDFVHVLGEVEMNRTKTTVAAVNSGIISLNEGRQRMNLAKYPDKDAPDNIANMPMVAVNAQMKASAGLDLPGVEGGRDQSAQGEEQFIDESGRR
jgi:hypothetical protein